MRAELGAGERDEGPSGRITIAGETVWLVPVTRLLEPDGTSHPLEVDSLRVGDDVGSYLARETDPTDPSVAVAVFLDAFIVRMALIPALMYLMGDKAWYLPKWLDRILPNVDIEGENLHRPHLTRTTDESAERTTADA